MKSEETVERLPIKEAALRLRVSQDVIRRRIRNGELRASRRSGPQGDFWEVELPEEGQLADSNAHLQEQAQLVVPWWWTNAEKTGRVHYVESIETEEVIAHHLCGLISQGIWNALGHSKDDRCPECVQLAEAQGLPLEGATSLVAPTGPRAKIWGSG
jgi:hypothetical protein